MSGSAAYDDSETKLMPRIESADNVGEDASSEKLKHNQVIFQAILGDAQLRIPRHLRFDSTRVSLEDIGANCREGVRQVVRVLNYSVSGRVATLVLDCGVPYDENRASYSMRYHVDEQGLVRRVGPVYRAGQVVCELDGKKLKSK